MKGLPKSNTKGEKPMRQNPGSKAHLSHETQQSPASLPTLPVTKQSVANLLSKDDTVCLRWYPVSPLPREEVQSQSHPVLEFRSMGP